jgi:DUF971 family protein
MALMTILPVEIKRLPEGIAITWNDALKATIPVEKLRKECPCATCKEARGDTSHAKPLSSKKGLLKVIEHTKNEELDLKEIWAVGNYALGLGWGDGHASGIYTYALLRELCSS